MFNPLLGAGWVGCGGVCPHVDSAVPTAQEALFLPLCPGLKVLRLPGQAFLEGSCLGRDESSLTEEAGTSLVPGPDCSRISLPPNQKCRVHEKEGPPVEKASGQENGPSEQSENKSKVKMPLSTGTTG